MQKTTMTIAVVAVVLILLGAGGLYYYVEFMNKQPEERTVVLKEFDDRISPLEDQGLVLEILRIRHRGLYDRIIKPGTSWRNQPMFYFISNVDNLEYISKDVTAKNEVLYTGWDTMFQENKVLRKVPQEQPTSDVQLTILERVKTGLLGRRTTDIERETIQVTYDYRTGRWTGDDSFKDEDGYGHYIGQYFEVWFNVYQMDYDHDGIPYWTEVNVLKTDPRVDDSNLDPDGDGIPTAWEWKWGYDPFVWDDQATLDPDIDGLTNIQEYQMAKWFADPFSQDLYIEADFMTRKGLFDPQHIFFKESQQILIELFSRHGIKMYVDDGWPGGPTNGGGDMLPYISTMSQDSGMILQFYNNYFANERKGIFRYMVIGHAVGGFNHPSKFNKYDSLFIANNLKLYILFGAFTPRVQRLMVADVAQHEIGHSLGISPWSYGGCDNVTYMKSKQDKAQFLENWGNYRSAMNYYYLNQMDTKRFVYVDYSDGSHGPTDQNDWLNVYLPSFKLEAPVIEEVHFEPPGDDKIVIGEDFKINGWNYSNDLTQQYTKKTAISSPITPIESNWRVYVKTDGTASPSDRNLRVYAQPNVPFAGWSLINEGYVDVNGNIKIV